MGHYTFLKKQPSLLDPVIHYVERAPSPNLLPYVECIWTLKSHSQFFKKRELIIPGGRAEMIFNLNEAVKWIDSKDISYARSYAGAYLLGPRNRHFFVEQTGTINMLGIRFRHGGLASFTSIPMDLLMNDVVMQDQIFGKEVNTLVDQLFDVDAEESNVLVLQNFLSRRFQGEPSTKQTLQLISRVKDCESLLSFKTLSEKTGVHYKKLERIFSRYTGYGPKNFSRVVRFYKTLQQMKKSSLTLTGVGLNNGYYDQPHFIRDFKAFTGKTPTQFQTENPTIANLLLQSKHV